MGATLEETLAEMDQEQTVAQQRVPVSRPVPIASPPTPAPIKPAKDGFFERIIRSEGGDVDKRIAKSQQFRAGLGGAATGIIRAPGQLIGGVVDSFNDVGRFVDNNIQSPFLRHFVKYAPMGPVGWALVTGSQDINRQLVTDQKGAWGSSVADVLSMRESAGKWGDQGVNQFSTEAIATVIPMLIPGGGLAKGGEGALAWTASKVPQMAKAATGGAAAMDAPNGLQDRLKNAAIGATLELGGELIFKGGSILLKRYLSKATPKEAAEDALDRAFATDRTEVARDELAARTDPLTGEVKPAETLPQEELPSGTRAGDRERPAPIKAAKPDGGVEGNADLVQSANTALERAGVAERVAPDSLRITEDGKVVVSGGAKAALDETPYGRAFASVNEAAEPATIFKESSADGSQRVVGSMKNADLERLKADIVQLRDHPGDIDLKAPRQWKLTRLGSDYDAPSVLRAIIEGIPKGPAVLGDDVAMAAARDAADQFGSTPEDAIGFALSVMDEGIPSTDTHTALITLSTIWKRMGESLDNIISDDLQTMTDDVADQAREAVHNLQIFSSIFEEVKAGQGRALRALGLPDADTYKMAWRQADSGKLKVNPKDVNQPPPLPRTREELRDFLEMWKALPPENRMEFLKGIKQYPSGGRYLREAFPNFYTGMILSGLKTVSLNMVGPAVVGGLRTVERMSGAGLMMFNPVASAAERSAARAVAAQAPIAYFQTIGDIATAFRLAAGSIKEGRSKLGAVSSLDFALNGVPEPFIQAAVRDGASPIPYHLGNLINFLPRQVWRMHAGATEVGSVMAYMGEVRAKAMLEATQAGLKGAEFGALVKQRIADSIEATGKATDGDALQQASRTNLINRADQDLNPVRNTVDNGLKRLRELFPESRYILPVFHQPANALGESFRRVPILNFALKETRQELMGDFGTIRQAEAHGRMVLGGALLTSGFLMARAGNLTGAGPADPADRKVWMDAGFKPYSIRVGNMWVGYDKLDPIGPLLGVMAGMFAETVWRDGDQDTQNLSLAAVGSLAEYMKDKAALQGIATLLNFGGDPQDAGKVEAFLKSMVAGATVPNLVRPIRAGLDPSASVKRTTWDYIRANIPGASLGLDPVRNILGEIVHIPQDSFWSALSPVVVAPTNPHNDDPVMNEIYRLYHATGYTPGNPQTSGGPNSGFDMRDVKLENGRSLNNWVLKARQTSTIGGVTLREALTSLVQSPEYQNAPDGTGKVFGDEADGPTQDSKGGLLQKTFKAYNKAARADVAKESPLARRWMAVAKVKQYSNDRLSTTPALDIVRNPSLLDSLGIDLQAYEDKAQGASAQ